MNDKKIKWTKQQADAIKERGRDVLVTASAGTGKTAVLSGRCVDIVSDKNICPDIWSILVVTFTDAAAEQMRQRIANLLAAEYENSNAPHLRRQLVLLQGADISTIHSFCKRIITEHFHELGIDPTFGIIDTDEQRLIKSQVLEQTIEWAWEQPNLEQPLRELLSYRNLNFEDSILNSVIDIGNFLEGVIDRDNWYSLAGALAGGTDTSEGLTGQKQKLIARQSLQQIIDRLGQIKNIYSKQNTGGDWGEKLQSDFLEPFQKLQKLADEQSFTEFANKLAGFKKKKTTTPTDLPENLAKLLKDSLKQTIDRIDNIRALAVFNPDYIDKISTAATRQTKLLIELVKKFDRLYSEVKRKLNRLDFADLERFMLRLLSKEIKPDGKIEPSETALVLQQKYQHIFVDEYQDINQVQKAIIDLLSTGDNVFVVGDIKQSIYAFRGAAPAIFAADLKTASVSPGDKDQSRRVDLNLNFRSDKGVLDFINHVFGRLMTESLAGIDYDQSAHLKPAFEEEQKQQTTPAVELHLLESDGSSAEDESSQPDTDESAEDITAGQRQAAAIARRIQQLVADEQIYDNKLDQYRPIRYSDIVILMRSPAKRANRYVEILQMAGIPISSESAAGYFQTTEINDCLSLLKVLDNPQRDIELAAVLRSPFFKISDSRLAKIRLFGDENKNFYDCICAYAESGQDKELSSLLRQVLDDIESWRNIAATGGIADLLWTIFRKTNLLAFVSALPNGKGRKANLLKLHDRAIQFENFAISGGAASLSRFVWFIEKLHAEGAEWSTAEPEDTAADAVRLMSIHKSKGLEFPIVFLAETDSRFNLKDTTKDVLLSNELPIGLQVIDPDAKVKLSTAAHQVLARDRLATNLAEEMRILYVAMTRAKQKLIITANVKRKMLEHTLIEGLCFDNTQAAQFQLADCRSFIRWLLYALADQKILHEEIQTGFDVARASPSRRTRDSGQACPCPEFFGNLFSLKFYTGSELAALGSYVQNLRKVDKKTDKTSEKAKPQPDLLEKVKQALSYKYDYETETALPAKQSVTQLTHFNDEFVNIDYSQSLQRLPAVVLAEDSGTGFQPVLNKSATIGSASHLVISKIDLDKKIDAESISKIIDELIAEELITKQTAEYINTESILAFFDSDLGALALDKTNIVHREWPFTFALPAFSTTGFQPVDKNVHGQDARATIVIQGIVDMLIETPAGIVIIDFKTDRVSAKETAERAQRYATQLNLYAQAANAILNKPICAKWLYFLAPGRKVRISRI
ncbi:MAG: helicase-exonuclease AddAB subunit AddA [Sedimentisphaerales bacterium]|nr:helicase-exonuclease AddAB subunit AddA [Sedimentisphaerales bacterium]